MDAWPDRSFKDARFCACCAACCTGYAHILPAMRRILVTGANKGIGLAIAQAILTEHDDTFVFLGSRDETRGHAAAAELAKKERVAAITLDVATDTSVAAAAKRVAEICGGEKLYGIVNNAGLGSSGGDLAAILQTNTLGVFRVCEAFLPLIAPRGGRIVNVTSASGPMFVAKCSEEWKAFFLDDQITWPRIAALVEECRAINDKAPLVAKGLGDANAYGLSKACANSYTMVLAREHPELVVNACTPGSIATDMSRGYAEAQGKTPEELGMKPPSEGAKAPMHLLFGALEGSGRYYGSDAKRSPLDRYRAPGSAPYDGS
jgi:NAD(P)-dependent dehydrogenase (short-subunit alcohol dehydrogenase family)